MRCSLRLALAAVAVLPSARAFGHHEALFGAQSSLAVEAQAFASVQTHVHAYGVHGQETEETTTIVSGGLQPLKGVPFGIVLVLPFTYETSRAPTAPGTTGPFTVCDRCVRLENALFAVQYRLDLKRLQRRFRADGNFALLSAAIEPATGNKDYPPLTGPTNWILAAMIGLEKGRWSSVALGYYRLNTLDVAAAKKGDNFLLGLGGAFTPYERSGRMISVQLGVGFEHHLRDVAAGAAVAASGGSQLLVSPTVVVAPVRGMRIFALATLPLAQSMRGDANLERWRVGLGVIYAFEVFSAPR